MTADRAELRDKIAEALHAYNTAAGLHFVIHDGEYEEMADAVLPAFDSWLAAVLADEATVEAVYEPLRRTPGHIGMLRDDVEAVLAALGQILAGGASHE